MGSREPFRSWIGPMNSRALFLLIRAVADELARRGIKLSIDLQHSSGEREPIFPVPAEQAAMEGGG